MSDFLHDPPRWKDRTDQASLAERGAGQLVRALGTAEPLSTAQLTRIAARIRAERPHPHRLRFWVPVTAALLFGGVAAASAAHVSILPHWLLNIVKREPAAPAGRTTPPHTAHARPSVPSSAMTPLAVPAESSPPAKASLPDQPGLAPQPAGSRGFRDSLIDRVRGSTRKTTGKTLDVKPFEQVVDSRPVLPQPIFQPQPPTSSAFMPVDRPAAPATAPATQMAWVDRPAQTRHVEPVRTLPDKLLDAPPPASEAGGAIKYLTIAIRALRVEHSPEAALALLDHYAGDLDKSPVRHEALLLRIEAMLKLNRQAEALQLLDATPLAGVAASRTLLVTRGELRMAAGRCADAVGDFDLVLAQTLGHNRRALLGRAKCRKQLGDDAGARADGERYRREFPTDPHVHEVEKLFGPTP